VTQVRVAVDPTQGGPVGEGHFAYRYLTAEMLRVEVTLRDGATTVVAVLEHHPELRYPLMRVISVEGSPGPSDR
jgi:hypothetical protein